MLGKIDAENFAGGSIVLSVANAEQALEAEIGKPLGMDVTAAAFGTTEMVDENMANAARVHAVENGKDISQFALIAFGGGAPLHACRQAEKLGMHNIIVPPGAGVGSAIGFLRAPFSSEETRGAFCSDIAATTVKNTAHDDELNTNVSNRLEFFLPVNLRDGVRGRLEEDAAEVGKRSQRGRRRQHNEQR